MDIDFVITWVDGTQKDWINNYNKYLPLNSSKKIDVSESRYRDNGLLKYWFRSVEKFAPWVRKVHLITDNQKPIWLNEKCEKLNLVYHQDYIDTKFLPLFNSNAIELGMHKIKDLADNFVYFNDDFFLINKITPDYYFSRDGIVDDFATIENIVPHDDFGQILLNNEKALEKIIDKNKLIRKKIFNYLSTKYPININLKNLYRIMIRKYNHLQFSHYSQPYKKEVFNEVWNLLPNELIETIKNRYRTNEDISHYIFREYNIFNNKIKTSYKNKKRKYFDISDNLENLLEHIRNQKCSEIVINDQLCEDYQHRIDLIRDSFEIILPKKSIFEL